jgi:hypothetical protein
VVLQVAAADLHAGCRAVHVRASGRVVVWCAAEDARHGMAHRDIEAALRSGSAEIPILPL